MVFVVVPGNAFLEKRWFLLLVPHTFPALLSIAKVKLNNISFFSLQGPEVIYN
jgi:hypothetical protein